jgi:hypothetical protein
MNVIFSVMTPCNLVYGCLRFRITYCHNLRTEFLLNSIYKNSGRTSQETHHISVTKIKRLMLIRERIAVYFENYTKHTNALCG